MNKRNLDTIVVVKRKKFGKKSKKYYAISKVMKYENTQCKT